MHSERGIAIVFGVRGKTPEDDDVFCVFCVWNSNFWCTCDYVIVFNKITILMNDIHAPF